MRSRAFHAVRHYVTAVRLARAAELDLIPGWRRAKSLVVFTGGVEQIARGVYSCSFGKVDAIAMAAFCVDGARVALASALQVHGFVDPDLATVFLAIPHKARAPKTLPDGVRVRLLRYSTSVGEDDVETRSFGPVMVRVFGLAKTLIDCFRHARALPKDFPTRALHAAIHSGKVTREEIERRADGTRFGGLVRRALPLADCNCQSLSLERPWPRMDPAEAAELRRAAMAEALAYDHELTKRLAAERQARQVQFGLPEIRFDRAVPLRFGDEGDG